MKKCVDNKTTTCFLPKANCNPLCQEKTINYPYNCECNSSFPENWMKCTKKLNDTSKTDVFKKATYQYDGEPSVKSIVD